MRMVFFMDGIETIGRDIHTHSGFVPHHVGPKPPRVRTTLDASDQLIARWGTSPRGHTAPELLAELARHAQNETVTLLCSCQDETRCHRTLLKGLIETVAA